MKAKRLLNVVVILVSVLLFSAFILQNGGYIKGKVVPAENAVSAFAISGTDTVKSKITGGNIELSKLKPGTYQLWIEASEPYNHKLITDVQVKEGAYTDVGEIQLEAKK